MPRHSILVVDEYTLRHLLEERLGRRYNVRTASNGEEALERVAEEPPDLVVSAITLPRMDGFALKAALQERRGTRAIPFIFLTMEIDESHLEGRRKGAEVYIAKPFDIDHLLSSIETLLE